MKILRFMAMLIATVALCAGFSACNNDDDDDNEPKNQNVAEVLAGKHNGVLSISVMGSVSTDSVTFEITKADDTHINMVVPSVKWNTNVLPEIPLSNIETVANAEVATASADQINGSVTVSDSEKSYTFSNLVIAKKDDKVSVNYTLKYGNMPMAMTCSFVSE